MQIKIRNYQYSGSILHQRIPQFLMRQQNQPSNKLQTTPQKYYFEKSPVASRNKFNKYVNMKTLSLSREIKNQIWIQQKPILYAYDIDNDTYIRNQKTTQINKKVIPQQTKIQETILLLDRNKIGQQFRRFSEKLSDSQRNRAIKLKLKQKPKGLSKDLDSQPKGWSHRSSKSLI